MKKIKFAVVGFVMIALLICSATAADKTWNGDATDDYWSTGANWVGGSAAGWQDTAIFTGNAGTTDNPDMNQAVPNGLALDFQSAGWVIRDDLGGGSIRVDGLLFIHSAGVGVNRIECKITSSGADDVGLEIGPGNTLQLSGGFLPGRLDFGTSSGTMVFDTIAFTNSLGSIKNIGAPMTLLVNSPSVFSIYGGTISNGCVLGGTGILQGWQYNTTTIADGGKIAPGGDGTFGAEIGTLIWECNSDTIRHELVMGNGASLEIQLGDTLGQNDKLALELSDAGKGNLTIQAGVTLNLYGDSIPDGDYTIVENIDSDPIVGTFSATNYNGSAIDPANFTVTYNTDSIVVSVTGMAAPSGTVVTVN